MFTKVSTQAIESWKEKYGEGNLLVLKFKGGEVYFQKPEKTPNYFHTAKRVIILQQQQDLLSAGEVVFNETYLGGLGDRKDINKNSSIYINTCVRCGDLIELLEANFTIA